MTRLTLLAAVLFTLATPAFAAPPNTVVFFIGDTEDLHMPLL